jgi:hypothetical protein
MTGAEQPAMNPSETYRIAQGDSTHRRQMELAEHLKLPELSDFTAATRLMEERHLARLTLAAMTFGISLSEPAKAHAREWLAGFDPAAVLRQAHANKAAADQVMAIEAELMRRVGTILPAS